MRPACRSDAIWSPRSLWPAPAPGPAGGAFAFLQRFISPDSFRLDTSFLMVAIIVLGGLGNLTGALLGAATLR